MKNRNYKEQERARPSGTHSFKEPSRTHPEYAPKDAPRLGTPFTCSSSDKSIDGILNEPLQRITLNRTARGVAARLGPPSSLPIAPTRTTPAPTRESIAKSARGGAGNFRGVGAIPSRTRDGAFHLPPAREKRDIRYQPTGSPNSFSIGTRASK